MGGDYRVKESAWLDVGVGPRVKEGVHCVQDQAVPKGIDLELSKLNCCC